MEIRSDQYLLLQPTRVVPRKQIEIAVELARRLDLECSLLISHASGDEGTAYEAYLKDYADLMGVRFAGHPDLRRVFLWEGFAGHPLRKDWMEMPGGFTPGLGRFPRED